MSTIVEKKVAFNDKEYQLKLFSRVFYNNDFAEDVIYDLDASLFGEVFIKRICNMVKNYVDKYKVLPPISNIRQIAETDETINETEKLVIVKYLDKMTSYKKEVENGNHKNDYDYIEQTFVDFIKSQRLGNTGNELLEALTFGDIVKANKLIDKLLDIREYGVKNDYGVDVRQTYKSAIKNPFKDRIPTGLDFIDKVIGGVPKGDLALIMAPSGVGKSTVLAYISEHMFSMGKNVLHIIFDENTVDDTKRKFIAKWSGIPPSQFEAREDYVEKKVDEVLSKIEGKLIIKNFISEGVTVPKIRSFILKYQKRYGLKFDMVVIDYMDELESHKDKIFSEWDSQTHVAKALKSLASELNIPVWSAIQTKKDTAIKDKKFLDKSDAGGAVAKIKKAQLIIGIMHEDLHQQNRGSANFSIAKCNYAKAGNVWYECEFNNELLIVSEGKLSNQMAPDLDEDELEKQQMEKERQRQEALIKSAIANNTSEDKKNILLNL
jgi:archaellum biogenesis ATPase FlaH